MHVVQILIVLINALKTKLMRKKCQNEPRKAPKIDTTLVLFYVDTRNILKVRRGNIYCFVPQGGTYPAETIRLVVREALVCEKLIPTPAPYGTIFLLQYVAAIP